MENDKINELKQPLKDPNLPESQKFLKELAEEILQNRKKFIEYLRSKGLKLEKLINSL